MTITVSTVTPVYQGEAYLPKLIEALAQQREKWLSEKAPVALQESIFVVDGAVDNSHSVLIELAEQHSWVTVISLSRNYGQHAATVAGICHTASDWVVTLDEDLQHHPREIDQLFSQQVGTQADVVYALPKAAVHGNSWRDFSSRLTKELLSKLTGTPQIKLFNSFRLIRGSIARAAGSSSSSQTYLDIALTWFTKSFASADIDMHDDRYIQSKSSGYGLLKLIAHARKLIVSSHVDIASAGMLLGLLAIVAAIIIGVGAVLQKVLFPETITLPGWASTVAIMTFFGGIIISLLCIALEYINVLVINQLGKPTFFTIDRSGDQQLVNWFSAK